MTLFTQKNSVKKVTPWFITKNCRCCKSHIIRESLWKIARNGTKYYICINCAKNATEAQKVLDNTFNNTFKKMTIAPPTRNKGLKRNIVKTRPKVDTSNDEEANDLRPDAVVAVMAGIELSDDTMHDIPVEEIKVIPENDNTDLFEEGPTEPSEFTSIHSEIIQRDTTEPSIVEDNTSYEAPDDSSSYDSFESNNPLE